MDNNRTRIRFEVTDELGDTYIQESIVDLDNGCHTFPEEAGRLLNLLLKQMTFPRENDYIFMEDVTEEEIEVLDNFLQEYRKEKKGEGN